MECRLTEVEPPCRLTFTFGNAGVVAFTLKPVGNDVLLTLIHSRVPDRSTLLRVSTGWHLHLDLLASRAAGETPKPFWDGWNRLQKAYDERHPA